MNPSLPTTSPLWTAAGWTMLHMMWVGAAIGVMAVLARRLMKSTGPETRYAVALAFLLVGGTTGSTCWSASWNSRVARIC
jgi:hypothetical protein